MAINIQVNDDTDTIRTRLGSRVGRDQLRSSSSRRTRLEKSSQRRTREWDLTLELDPEHQTAHCDQMREHTKIVVSAREFDQPVTDLPPRQWDYVAQRALGWHEDGHVLFTDHDDFMDRLNNVSAGNTGTAKQIWNALEDGAIEKALIERWDNAYEVLRVLRANLFDKDPGIFDVENGGQVFPVVHAIQAVLLDEWMTEVYGFNRDVKAKLLNDDPEYHFATDDDAERFEQDILPEIEAVIPKVLTTPDAVDRNRIIFEFIDEVLDDVEDADADGKAQTNRDDGETQEGMPDDASDGHSGEAKRDAESLGEMDPDDIDAVEITDIGNPDEDYETVELPADVEVDIADDVADQVREEADIGDTMIDEMEELQEALQAGGEELATNTIQIPDEDWDADESVYQTARQGSQTIAQVLRNRLQQERTSEVQRNQRRGRFTGRGGATVRALDGKREVKEQVSEPDEKDYHFGFIIDRSGSMRHTMTAAEEAMLMLALALEDVGVNVMIVEMFNRNARVAKPFGVSVEAAKDNLAHGNCDGGTPLTPSVELVRERLNQAGENTALVVVTDGQPSNEETFEEAISACSMPTLGINLTKDDEPSGMDDYDRAVASQPQEDLQQVLQELVQEVMF